LRCRACNIQLNDMELRRKDKHGVHLDMCHKCADQSYLYANATYDIKGNLVSLSTPVESDFRWGYVGGAAVGPDADLVSTLADIYSGVPVRTSVD
jgi:hypothetical protein